MNDVVAKLAEQASAWSPLEIVAVVAAILYLLLAIRQHISCWLFALVSTAIYVVLFLEARLYMESVLNGFYFGMAVYGFFSWRHGGDNDLPVTSAGWRFHLVAIALLTAGALLNGWVLAAWTDAAYPYIDSLTTWGAIWTTWLVARKILENWWYWLVIDAVSVVIYWSRGLELTALLFVLYLGMIPFGYAAWRSSLRREAA